MITAKKEKEIEDKINELVADGWEVEKFGYAFRWKLGETPIWALLVKKE